MLVSQTKKRTANLSTMNSPAKGRTNRFDISSERKRKHMKRDLVPVEEAVRFSEAERCGCVNIDTHTHAHAATNTGRETRTHKRIRMHK